MVGSCVDEGQMWIQIQVGTKVLSHDTAPFQNLKTMTFSFKFSRLTIRLSNIDVENPPKRTVDFPCKTCISPSASFYSNLQQQHR